MFSSGSASEEKIHTSLETINWKKESLADPTDKADDYAII